MAYFLGIDLGTTYTAAARWRDGRASIARLGSHSAEIPSVVLLKENGEVITGEAAQRRSLIEPHRVAREFKRRIGDPTPLFLGGTPCSAETLMAKLLRWVVDKVADDEGSLPLSVAVSHPANWGDYKKDLLQEAIRLAELPDVRLVVEPEAAAIHYASLARIEPGSVLAVYDLGGGTFDAAVVRRTGVGWEILGQPEGVDRLGGIDFDAAVLRHVARSVGEAYDALDPDDPPVLAAAARLRQECVSAKEALASDTDVSIPVLLPHLQTEVRLTRGEFEAMIRPSLAESILALERALRSAGVERDRVSRILLVGGSSRIPLVGQMVGSALGRPIAVDAHPKHGVALGAAIVAAQEGHERLSDVAGPRVAEHAGSAGPGMTGEAVSGVGSAGVAADGRRSPRPVVRAGASAATAAVSSSYQVPALAPGSARRSGGAAAPARTATAGLSPDEPQRPTLALLAGGAALLAAVVLVGLVLVSDDRDADATGDGVPDATPSTVPGDPGPAAVSPPPGVNGEAPAAPVDGVTTTLLPGVTTTSGPRATTTTAPSVTTTTAPTPTTTEPPAPTTTAPPTPTTTAPPTPTTTTEPVPTGSARQVPPG